MLYVKLCTQKYTVEQMVERARIFLDVLWVGQQPQLDPKNFLVLKHFAVNTLLRNVLRVVWRHGKIFTSAFHNLLLIV